MAGSAVPDWLTIGSVVVPIAAGVLMLRRADREQEARDQLRLAHLGQTSRFERPWYELTARKEGFLMVGVGLFFLLMWALRS